MIPHHVKDEELSRCSGKLDAAFSSLFSMFQDIPRDPLWGGCLTSWGTECWKGHQCIGPPRKFLWIDRSAWVQMTSPVSSQRKRMKRLRQLRRQAAATSVLTGQITYDFKVCFFASSVLARKFGHAVEKPLRWRNPSQGASYTNIIYQKKLRSLNSVLYGKYGQEEQIYK